MKSWKRAVTVALCAASLLAGCGGDCGLKDGEDYTVEDLRGINIPLALLERHEVVTVNVQYTDENGDVTYTARVQYTRNADGNVVSWGHYGYDPSENYPVSAKERWTQANGKVYLDRSSNEERTMMTCFTKIDYEMYVLADLPAIAEFEMGTEESEETIGLQNGVYLLSGSVTYPNLGGYHSKTLYEVEPGSGELHAMTVTDHAADDEAFDGKMRYTWSYDEPYAPERDLAGEALHELFDSSRGMLMIATIVVLALLYPRFGFTRRSVRADLKADRERILQTLHTSGYSLVAESEGTMIFRASSPLKRALLLWEDRIAVTADGESITLDGIRKEVVRAEFRLKSFLEQ